MLKDLKFVKGSRGFHLRRALTRYFGRLKQLFPLFQLVESPTTTEEIQEREKKVIEGLLAPLLDKLEKSKLPLPPYDYEWWLGRKNQSYSASDYNIIWESSKLPA